MENDFQTGISHSPTLLTAHYLRISLLSVIRNPRSTNDGKISRKFNTNENYFSIGESKSEIYANSGIFRTR